MLYGDTSRLGRPFAKDPAVVRFHNRYWLYHSIPPYGDGRPDDGWAIAIAQSRDLELWTKVGEIRPAAHYEENGLCAPGALVMDGKIHLFYQTYGNGLRDAICHAVSEDGYRFRRDLTNPIFAPTGDWTCGRAIDADVVVDEDQLLLYFATRDPTMTTQMLGVASASLDSDFGRQAWTQRCDGPILKPELFWEQECIEAPALHKRGDYLYMFYGGAYNNGPQQIGVATSLDGVTWRRLFDEPFLPNGRHGEWNACESGHPYLFVDDDGRTYLFYQGNNDLGETWFLSWREVVWSNGYPYLE